MGRKTSIENGRGGKSTPFCQQVGLEGRMTIQLKEALTRGSEEIKASVKSKKGEEI